MNPEWVTDYPAQGKVEIVKATPLVGPDSFWEMVALAISGQLASCVSCIEHHYFMSTANAKLFLETCALAGLLQKMPLLDLFGDVGPREGTDRRGYEEPIYLSAPKFQLANPDAARNRLAKTKYLVNSALRLFFEELRGDEHAVAAAYEHALQERKLKNQETAEQRRDVRLSALARLRLILQSFRFQVSQNSKDTETDSRSVDRAVTFATVEYVRRFVGSTPAEDTKTDCSEELETFLLEFLSNPSKIAVFWKNDYGALRDDYWLRWLPVIMNLGSARFQHLAQTDTQRAQAFAEAVRSTIEKAARKETSAAVLTSLLQEWDEVITSPNGPAMAWLVSTIEPSSNLHAG